MNGISGYEARLLGYITSLDDLSLFVPLEQGVPEESLMLMRLDFAAFPSSDSLAELDQALINAGIPTWPGNTNIVFADATVPTIYLAWVKGIAWMAIIIGIIAMIALPSLLGGLIWWLIPESIKNIINVIIMVAVMFLMMKFITPMLGGEKKPREIEGKT